MLQSMQRKKRMHGKYPGGDSLDNEVTYRNYIGCEGMGEEAEEAGIPLSECPYIIGTPRHTAWMRGWLRSHNRRMNPQHPADTRPDTSETLREAKIRAAKRNHRMFETDPSWYGLTPDDIR